MVKSSDPTPEGQTLAAYLKAHAELEAMVRRGEDPPEELLENVIDLKRAVGGVLDCGPLEEWPGENGTA